MFSAEKINAIIDRCIGLTQKSYWWHLPLNENIVAFRLMTKNAVSLDYNLLSVQSGLELASCEYLLPDQRRFYLPLATYRVSPISNASADAVVQEGVLGFETRSFRYQLAENLYSENDVEVNKSFFSDWRDFLFEKDPNTQKPSWLPRVNDDGSIYYNGINHGNVHPDAPTLFRVLVERYPYPVAVSNDPATKGIVLSRVRASLKRTAKPLDDLIKSKSGGGTWLER